MAEQSNTVTEVIDGRVDVYGDPVEGMVRTAQIWSGILGHEVQPADVPLMLIGYKLMRAQRTPDYSDNSDDVEGYLDIFRKVVGDDMVVARSVSDYLAQITARAQAQLKPVLEPLHQTTRTLSDGTDLHLILPSQAQRGDIASLKRAPFTDFVVTKTSELEFWVDGSSEARAKTDRVYDFWRPTWPEKTEAQSRANAAG